MTIRVAITGYGRIVATSSALSMKKRKAGR